MALARALGPSVRTSSLDHFPRPGSSSAEQWSETLLCTGSMADLTALLDSGLDPNTATADGTTLLMMAVPDLEKDQVTAGPRSQR